MFNVPVSEFGFIPTRVSNCALWLDATDASTITQVAGAVSQWNDKSGNGNNATQPTGANQPSTGSLTINSLNAIGFNGTTGFMKLPSALYTIPNGSNTAFVVRKATSAPGSGGSSRIFSAQDGGSNRYFIGLSNPSGTTSTVALNGPNGSNTSGVVYTASAVIDTFIRSGTSQTQYQNGTGVTSNSLAANLTATQFNIGCQTTTPNNLLTGSIGEMLIYSSALSNSDIDLVGSYLSVKWGISWTTI